MGRKNRYTKKMGHSHHIPPTLPATPKLADYSPLAVLLLLFCFAQRLCKYILAGA